jgi:uncharacterized protein YdeI (YjbR/CyaY-like superfamily)
LSPGLIPSPQEQNGFLVSGPAHLRNNSEHTVEIGKTLYVKDRKSWRAWLRKNYNRKSEIWLIYYKLNSGKKRIPYDVAIEEALCFGWIDSIAKPIDQQKYAQRFSPRRPGSQLSETNRERVRRLIKSRRMTRAGLAAITHAFRQTEKPKRVTPANDVLEALQSDKQTWANFQKFPQTYKRIRIWWIEASRNRPEVFRQRLAYFVKMTAQNKKFGMVQ